LQIRHGILSNPSDNKIPIRYEWLEHRHGDQLKTEFSHATKIVDGRARHGHDTSAPVSELACTRSSPREMHPGGIAGQIDGQRRKGTAPIQSRMPFRADPG
jgi:hypothetical protein